MTGSAITITIASTYMRNGRELTEIEWFWSGKFRPPTLLRIFARIRSIPARFPLLSALSYGMNWYYSTPSIFEANGPEIVENEVLYLSMSSPPALPPPTSSGVCFMSLVDLTVPCLFHSKIAHIEHCDLTRSQDTRGTRYWLTYRTSPSSQKS